MCDGDYPPVSVCSSSSFHFLSFEGCCFLSIVLPFGYVFLHVSCCSLLMTDQIMRRLCPPAAVKSKSRALVYLILNIIWILKWFSGHSNIKVKVHICKVWSICTVVQVKYTLSIWYNILHFLLMNGFIKKSQGKYFKKKNQKSKQCFTCAHNPIVIYILFSIKIKIKKWVTLALMQHVIRKVTHN